MSEPGSRRNGRGRRRSAGGRATRAALLLLVIAACLLFLLLVLPRAPQGPTDGAAAGTPPAVAAPPAGAAPPQEPAPSVARATRPERRSPAAAAAAGCLAIVIDDVGYSLAEVQPFLDTRLPLSLAVLPGLDHSAEAARRVRAAGQELLLHLPMQADNGADPGPGAVLVSMSEAEVHERLEAALRQVPAVGVNNHMGSAATADRRTMEVVLRYLQGRDLFFLDSRTTPASVVIEVAEGLRLPVLERNVFLDNEPSAEKIEVQLREAIEISARQGQAVAIGHVRNGHLVAILERALPELQRRNIRLVRAGELIAPEEP